MTSWDISTVSEEFLVDLCEKTLEEEGSIGDVGGIPVVKIPPNIVAKIGRRVAHSEASTQTSAHKELDPSIAYVPEVYRHFRRSRGAANAKHGYLFMEYVPGRKLQDLETGVLAELAPSALNIIKHLGEARGGSAPGPAGGGGIHIWRRRRKGVVQLRRRDERLHEQAPGIQKHSSAKGRRNIILRDDDSLCLLDWGYAGFYPRFFEVLALKCTIPYVDTFEGALEREVEAAMELTDEERRDFQHVMFVRGVNFRWSLKRARANMRNQFSRPTNLPWMEEPNPGEDRAQKSTADERDEPSAPQNTEVSA